MSKGKITGIIISGFIAFLIFGFGMEMLGLQWTKYFKPKWQNVEREVFEETKSYTHGVIQDLGKYYQEYQNGTIEEKETIKNVIQFRFAEFEADKIDNQKLKNFLINVRGY